MCSLGSLLIRLGFTFEPTILGWSAVLVEAMTIMCVMALEWPPMLLAQDTMLVSPVHLLGFLWGLGVN